MKFSKLKAAIMVSFLSLCLFVGYQAKSAIQLGGSIFPLTYISTPNINTTDGFNQMLSLLNQQVAAFPTNKQGAAFQTAPGLNPLIQLSYVDIPAENGLLSQGNGVTNNILVAPTTGVTIFPVGGGVSMFASGAETTGTGVTILCSPSGNKIMTPQAAYLLNNLVIGGFFSTTAAVTSAGNIPLASAFTAGCLSGDGVVASGNSSTNMGTMTDLFINFPYVTYTGR
jgi:hypothetical protein